MVGKHAKSSVGSIPLKHIQHGLSFVVGEKYGVGGEFETELEECRSHTRGGENCVETIQRKKQIQPRLKGVRLSHQWWKCTEQILETELVARAKCCFGNDPVCLPPRNACIHVRVVLQKNVSYLLPENFLLFSLGDVAICLDDPFPLLPCGKALARMRRFGEVDTYV